MWFWFLMTFLLFYGTKRTDKVTRIAFFGQTLYERTRNPQLSPPDAAFALDDGSENGDEAGEEESNQRDLWDRLEDAGFPHIDEERSLRLMDIGSIVDEEADEECDVCASEMRVLREVYASQNENEPVGRATENWIGEACVDCGHYRFSGDRAPTPIGKLAPLLIGRPNFFDVLEYFERMRGGEGEAATQNVDRTFLEGRRDQLEGELNEVRLAIVRDKQRNGEGQAYREADVPEPKTTP